MTDLAISLDQALAMRDKGVLLVDARSPAEFAEATIPGAVNIPLFDNDERAKVGTVYKTVGKAAAKKLGIELISPKIPAMIEQAMEAVADARPPVIVFCWRGGLRSRAMTAFFDLGGIPARQMIGGYKAFRAHVLDFLGRGEWGRLLVLRGLTGVGKTKMLLRLRQEGYPILDLEGLARHRGSAFGALGLPPQPNQKTFENLLWDELHRIPPQGFAITEGESRHIGRLILPVMVYQSLQKETTLWLNASLDCRTLNILDDYPSVDRHDFAPPIAGLRRRLGGEAVERLLRLLQDGKQKDLVRELMVLYYDPLYNHTKSDRRIEIDIESETEGLDRLKTAIAQVLTGASDKIHCAW
jgi:tRNA 2-selenouridine synthase